MATSDTKHRIGNLDYKRSAVKEQAAYEEHRQIDRQVRTRSNISWQALDTIIDLSYQRTPIRTMGVSSKVNFHFIESSRKVQLIHFIAQLMQKGRGASALQMCQGRSQKKYRTYKSTICRKQTMILYEVHYTEAPSFVAKPNNTRGS